MTGQPGLDSIIPAYMQLSTSNVSDALDRLGLSGAPHGILPVWPGCRKIAGPAATLRLVPPDAASTSPVVGSLQAVLEARPGDVLVIDHGGRMDVNSYGGIVGFTSQHCGLAGCVIDGVTRDVDEYKALDFPVYARGVIQQSIRGRSACAGYAIPVSLGGVTVRPGDLVMADDNGVVVVPAEHAEVALRVAQECQQTEARIIEAIRQGVDPVEAHARAQYERGTS